MAVGLFVEGRIFDFLEAYLSYKNKHFKTKEQE